jgi:excisionase family DNA binding protein
VESTVDGEELLTLAEAVEFLGTSRPTMYRWLDRGEVKGLKVGKQWRFRKSDLVAYMERGPVAVATAPAEELEAEIQFLDEELRRAGAERPEEEGEEAGATVNQVADLGRRIMTLAFIQGASDIHLEPVRQGNDAYVLLRHRIDGLLHEVRRLPIRLHEALTLYLKDAAGMELSERRLPQDGRIHVTHAGHVFELRVSCLNTIHGEAIVIRIIDRTATRLVGLEQLGLSREDLEKIRALLREPNGVILAAGPVGSGRSTLLYSMVQATADVGKKTFIVADYVEHALPYTTPVPLNKKGGLTLVAALRGVMRHDPDVVMVDEMPDLQAAQMVQSMSLTGHTVLVPVQARGAAEAVRSLMEMGVEPDSLAGTILGVVCQRLVRRICETCKEPYHAAGEDSLVEWMRTRAATGGYEMPDEAQRHRGRGCDRCRNTGYKGRIGLFEVMVVDESMAEAILRGASGDELQDLALERGMLTLFADGARKVVEGITTPDEVRRALAVPL